jgi:hypothetical protein
MRSIFLKHKICSNILEKIDNKRCAILCNLQKLQLQIRHMLREYKKIKSECTGQRTVRPKAGTIHIGLYLFCFSIRRSNFELIFFEVVDTTCTCVV